MPGFIGFPEILILLVIVLVVFGPKRLPGLGRSLGTGIREFRDSVTGEPDRTAGAEGDQLRRTIAAADDDALRREAVPVRETVDRSE